MKPGRPKNTPDRFTAARKEAFLVALERSGEYKAACAAVAISYQTVYEHRQRSAEFQTACDDALGRQYDELMKIARKLAVEGLVTETYDKHGKVISSKRVYSERILLKMLARRDPAAWSDKVQIDQKVSGEVKHRRIKVEDMTRSQKRAARDFLKTIPDDDPRQN